jgi:hypothetical protein
MLGAWIEMHLDQAASGGHGIPQTVREIHGNDAVSLTVQDEQGREMADIVESLKPR